MLIRNVNVAEDVVLKCLALSLSAASVHLATRARFAWQIIYASTMLHTRSTCEWDIYDL